MIYIIREASTRSGKPLSATEVFQHDVHPFLRIPICCATQLQLTWFKTAVSPRCDVLRGSRFGMVAWAGV